MPEEKPLEAIELLRPLTIGTAREKGAVVLVSEIGEMTARQLIESGRAKPASPKKAEG
jgi:hypothetical protein